MNELVQQQPDDAEDTEPQVNNDPMSLPQTGSDKQTVAPDPAKVREAGREDHPITDDETGHAPLK